MTFRKSKSTLHRKTTVTLTVIGVLVLLVALLFILEKTSVTNFITSKNADDTYVGAQTTSDLPSAQPDYNGGVSAEENKDPGNTLREDRGSATVADTGGIPSSDASQSVTSQSDEITVYLPHKNGTIASGQELSGISALSVVQYRLIDSINGVIATGSLKVVDGRFSATLSFSTDAQEGQLDIFATAANGNEFSNIEIPLRFR